MIDALAGDTVKDLRDESGELRWESYLIKLLKGGRVVLAGQGRRGAIFAVYDLSRLFGVSPWYFFADVPVKKSEALFLPQNFLKTDWPSVQYRGIFLNDEEELNAWAKLHPTTAPSAPRPTAMSSNSSCGSKATTSDPPCTSKRSMQTPKTVALRMKWASSSALRTAICCFGATSTSTIPGSGNRAIKGFCMTIPSQRTARAAELSLHQQHPARTDGS